MSSFSSSSVMPANDVSHDVVLEQWEYGYDEAGNQVLVTGRQRFHDDTELTGPLGDVNTNPKARVSWQAVWPDAIGRVRVSADYGTNGSVALERPGVAPQRSATVLVSSTRYGGDGQAGAQIDPNGIETRWRNDAAGRRILLLEGCEPGAPAESREAARVTEYGYSPDGQMSRLVLHNAVSGQQVTRWVYGTTLEDSGVARSDLLRAKIYPESDDGDTPLEDGIDGVYERLEYGYNTQGQVTTMKDPNGTVHAYDYDRLGRQVQDRVTTLGEGVDGAVRRLESVYEVRGMLARLSSYDNATVGMGSVVNEVARTYDDFGLLEDDVQSASGPAVYATSPRVNYTRNGGTLNTTRLLSQQVVYPAGSVDRTVSYDYEATEVDEHLSRVSAVQMDEEGDVLQYGYMGEGRVVLVKHPSGTPAHAFLLSYVKASTQPVGDAGDKYTGYDRFGRTVDMPWAIGTAFSGSSFDRFQYGYDPTGKRSWKHQVAATNGGQDESYQYDRLSQVTNYGLGTLNLNHTAIGAAPALAEAFGYDPTGNWQSYQRQQNGASVLDQSRTHNRDNQMVQVDGNADGIGYDLAGNATRLPPTEDGDWDGSYKLVWDAWNRLVTVKSADGTTTIASYGYDGLTRRLKRTVGGVASQCLYNENWKPLLEWKTASPTTSRKYYVWGSQHRDELILRERDVSGDFDERLYVTHDYFNPTALVGTDGSVKERYGFSAFGRRRIMAPDFSTRSTSSYDWDCAFQGQFLDQETGFYNYGYRYLSPELGRWLNRDPIGEEGGINLYGDAGNDAVNSVDHLGRCVSCIVTSGIKITRIYGFDYPSKDAVAFSLRFEVEVNSMTDCWFGQKFQGDFGLLMSSPSSEIFDRPTGAPTDYWWNGGPIWYGGYLKYKGHEGHPSTRGTSSASTHVTFYDSPKQDLKGKWVAANTTGGGYATFRTIIFDAKTKAELDSVTWKLRIYCAPGTTDSSKCTKYWQATASSW